MNLDLRDHIRVNVSVFTGIIIVGFLGFLFIPSHAQETSEACARAEVRSINVSPEVKREALLDTTPAMIEIAPPQASETTPGRMATVTIVGPVLGSMDSSDVKTDLECTKKGLVITATITRSAGYHGAAAKNVLWRPRIDIEIILRQPEVIFEAIWKMRLTNGVELGHAQTPPYPDQKYPLTVKATLR